MYPQRDNNKLVIPKEQPTLMQKLESAMLSPKHSLHIYGSRVCCQTCNAAVSIKAQHVFEFISSACIINETYMSYAIGNAHTHPSHSVIIYGGVLLCVKCGSTGVNKAINLKNPCRSAKEDIYLYGLNNLNRYDLGKAPAGFPKWPYNKFKQSQQSFLRSWNAKLDTLRSEMLKQVNPVEPSEPSWPSDSEEVSIKSDASDDNTSIGDISSE